MATLTIHFCGFNGFAQFQSSEKVVRTFKDVTDEIESNFIHSHAKSIIIYSEWNYIAFASENQLYLNGFLGTHGKQSHRLQFEHSIKDISGTNKLCTVLLTNGLVYKIDFERFAPIEINTLILKSSSTPAKQTKRCNIFGVSNEISQHSASDEFITHFACGRSLSIAITNKNAVYNVPLRIFTFPSHIKIKKLVCGNEHCLILTTNGDLYACGSSSRGQLGLGTLSMEEEPVLVEALAGIKIIDVAAGGWHSLAVSAFNDLYVWGWNVHGQLGLPLYKPQDSSTIPPNDENDQQKFATVIAQPQLIDLPNISIEDLSLESQYSPVAVYAGVSHSIVKTVDGTLLGAGWNKYGQLSNDSSTENLSNFHVINVNFGENFDMVCGNWSTIAICKLRNSIKS